MAVVSIYIWIRTPGKKFMDHIYRAVTCCKHQSRQTALRTHEVDVWAYKILLAVGNARDTFFASFPHRLLSRCVDSVSCSRTATTMGRAIVVRNARTSATGPLVTHGMNTSMHACAVSSSEAIKALGHINVLYLPGISTSKSPFLGMHHAG